MEKKFENKYIYGHDIPSLRKDLNKAMSGIPSNATIESVNFDSGYSNEQSFYGASALIIYSTPLESNI